jgi:carbon-monoxide dehydrogenase small subunit
VPHQQIEIGCIVNGTDVELTVAAERTLADVLRNDLGLIGAKISCDSQVCGACTVLVDGQPVSGCTYLAYEVRGREVTTVEGLAPSATELHPLQQAFYDENAFQCGFCTSGMLLTAHAALQDELIREDDEALLEYLSGSICRCTGYASILTALDAVRDHYRTDRPADDG